MNKFRHEVKNKESLLKVFFSALETIDSSQDYPMEGYVLLDIVFPILFAFRKNGRLYLCYVLKLKEKKKLSAILTRTNYSNLFEIVTQKKSIYDGIGESIMYVTGVLGEKNVLKSRWIFKSKIDRFLPGRDYLLTDDIPNKVNLIRLSKVLKRRIRIENYFLEQTETTKTIKGFTTLTDSISRPVRTIIHDINELSKYQNDLTEKAFHEEIEKENFERPLKLAQIFLLGNLNNRDYMN